MFTTTVKDMVFFPAATLTFLPPAGHAWPGRGYGVGWGTGRCVWPEGMHGGGVHGRGMCVCPGECACPGGVHGWGDMHDWGHVWGGHAWPGGAWLGACMGKGACMANGGMCGEGSHAWQRGPCMVEGGCAWQRGVHGKGGMHGKWGCMARQAATVAGGTHPTGMHSC